LRGGLARRRWLANGLLVAGLALCGARLAWPPERYALYPACPVWTYLHIECPGCGATRALAALLRGHMGEAIRLNPLFVLLLPFGLGFALESYRRALRADAFRWPEIPAAALYGILAAACVFTAARNWIA